MPPDLIDDDSQFAKRFARSMTLVAPDGGGLTRTRFVDILIAIEFERLDCSAEPALQVIAARGLIHVGAESGLESFHSFGGSFAHALKRRQLGERGGHDLSGDERISSEGEGVAAQSRFGHKIENLLAGVANRHDPAPE